MSYRQTADFLLYDWLDVESLQSRPRFADHSRETFASVLDTCEKIAREKYAPHARLSDTEEPWFDGEKVHLPEPSHAAAKAYAESGMLAAAQDYEIGGMQLPYVVEMVANSFFSKAAIGLGAGRDVGQRRAGLRLRQAHRAGEAPGELGLRE
ncbi:MAG TPA: acyl-CoA dehydrogenase family protein, partial [Burkholderiaceae bacterium]